MEAEEPIPWRTWSGESPRRPRAGGNVQAVSRRWRLQPNLSPGPFISCDSSFVQGGTLFVAGNGGSMADAIHISGELNKAFKRPRPLPAVHRQRLAAQPDGEVLARHLQPGLRTVVLGINPALSSAVDNDFSLAHAGLAQEFYALARAGDVFLGISTSGNAENVAYTASVAAALGCAVIALTGEGGGRLARQADVVHPCTRPNDRGNPKLAYPPVPHAVCRCWKMLSGARRD